MAAESRLRIGRTERRGQVAQRVDRPPAPGAGGGPVGPAQPVAVDGEENVTEV